MTDSELTVGVVSKYFPPPSGGAQNHIHNICTRILEQNIQLRGLTTSSGNSELDQLFGVVRVNHKWNYPSIVYSSSQFVNKCDIIHIHSASGILSAVSQYMCKKQRTPSIVTLHGGGVVDRPDYSCYKKKLHNATREYILNNCDRVIATSKTLEREALPYTHEKKIVNIPNGVDHSFFNPSIHAESPYKEMDIDNDNNIMLSINMLKPVKGIQYLIEALPAVLEKHPDTVLVLVGDGDYTGYLRKKSEEFDVSDSIIFAGYVGDRRVVRNYLAFADLFVVPSSGESTSISTLEALAMNCPVVASPAGGLKEIIGDNQYGRIAEIFEPYSYDRQPPNTLPDRKINKLSDEINWVLNNPAKAKDLAISGREYIQHHHDWGTISNETVKQYKEVYNAY